MQGRKALKFAALLIPCIILSIATGCKREYPTRALSLPTYTPTITPTVALTNTPSLTATKTRTLTPSPTQTFQFSPTVTNTPTITLSPTMTVTPTATLTVTATNTAIPPLVIDDFEDGNLTINGILGIPNPGNWFQQNDGTCSPALSLASSPGDGSNFAGQLTGSGCTTFGSLGFYFYDDALTNDGHINAPSISTGVRFDIRKSGGTVTSVRYEYLDDFSLSGPPSGMNIRPGYGADLVVTSSWTPVTVFWSTATLPTWYTKADSSNDPGFMYGMHWIVNAANGSNFDIQLDNIAFVNDAPPAAPTPDCRKIDDMEDGDNRGIVYPVGSCGSNGSIGLHCGFWYSYQDALGTGTTIWPASTDKFTMSSPGANSSSFAARIYCTNSTGTGDIYAGLGLNMLDPKNFYDLTVSGLFTGIQFDAKAGAGSSTAVRFKMPDGDTDPDGGVCGSGTGGGKCYDDFGTDLTLSTAWTTYQSTFMSSSVTQVGYGYAPAAFNPSKVSALQWQCTEPGANVDIWVDNIILY